MSCYRKQLFQSSRLNERSLCGSDSGIFTILLNWNASEFEAAYSLLGLWKQLKWSVCVYKMGARGRWWDLENPMKLSCLFQSWNYPFSSRCWMLVMCVLLSHKLGHPRWPFNPSRKLYYTLHINKFKESDLIVIIYLWKVETLLMAQWERFCLPVQEMQERWVRSLGREDPLEKERATHFSILVWRIPWTEEPGGLQSMGLRRIKHNRATEHAHTNPIHESGDMKHFPILEECLP